MLPFEASARTINRMIGYSACLLPVILLAFYFAGQWVGSDSSRVCFHDSISHFYYSRTGGDILVGLLVGIGLMLMSFGVVQPGSNYQTARAVKRQGARGIDRALIFAAGICAIGVALFPTTGPGCTSDDVYLRAFSQFDWHIQTQDWTLTGGLTDTDPGAFNFNQFHSFGFPLEYWLENLHGLSAIGMFLILLYFAYVVFRASDDEYFFLPVPRDVWEEFTPQKRLRNRFYCGASLVMALAMAGLAFVIATDRVDALSPFNGVFVLESLALIPFGVAWLVKGRFIPAFNDPGNSIYR